MMQQFYMAPYVSKHFCIHYHLPLACFYTTPFGTCFGLWITSYFVQKQPPELFYNKNCSQKFRNFNFICNFIKEETLAQVFSCEFCEISKNTIFYRTPTNDSFCLQWFVFCLCLLTIRINLNQPLVCYITVQFLHFLVSFHVHILYLAFVSTRFEFVFQSF